MLSLTYLQLLLSFPLCFGLVLRLNVISLCRCASHFGSCVTAPQCPFNIWWCEYIIWRRQLLKIVLDKGSSSLVSRSTSMILWHTSFLPWTIKSFSPGQTNGHSWKTNLLKINHKLLINNYNTNKQFHTLSSRAEDSSKNEKGAIHIANIHYMYRRESFLEHSLSEIRPTLTD